MPKIRNLMLINTKVGIAGEDVLFDEEGVGEVKDEIYEELLTLANFFAVEEEEPKNPENDQIPLGDDTGKNGSEGEQGQQKPEVELATEQMTHKELDAKAKELGIKVEGDKKDKVQAINSAINNKSE